MHMEQYWGAEAEEGAMRGECFEARWSIIRCRERTPYYVVYIIVLVIPYGGFLYIIASRILLLFLPRSVPLPFYDTSVG